MKHVTAADGSAVDGGDDGFRDVSNDAVQALDLERAPLGVSIAAALGALFHVTAAAKCAAALSGQDDGGDLVVNPSVFERRDELVDGPAAEGVHAGGTVDRDQCEGILFDGVGDVGEVLELHGSTPCPCSPEVLRR